MRNNSNTPTMGNPIAAEAANTEEGEHRDCSRYCINAEEVGADGESVWLNEDYQEVDPDAYPDYDDTEDGEGVEA